MFRWRTELLGLKRKKIKGREGTPADDQRPLIQSPTSPSIPHNRDILSVTLDHVQIPTHKNIENGVSASEERQYFKISFMIFLLPKLSTMRPANLETTEAGVLPKTKKAQKPSL